MSVRRDRLRTVANYLRSHSGITAIQADSDGIKAPKPYVITMTGVGSMDRLAEAARVSLSVTDGMPIMVRYRKGEPVSDAVAMMPLSTLASLLEAHYERRVEGRQD